MADSRARTGKVQEEPRTIGAGKLKEWRVMDKGHGHRLGWATTGRIVNNLLNEISHEHNGL